MNNSSISTATVSPASGVLDRTASRDRHASSALAAAVLGFFVVTLDAVVVNVTLPTIRTDLGGGVAGLQWVVDGYTLMFAALLLTAGSLSDRLGACRAFGVGVAVFVLASVACGFAPTLEALVAARFVQGAAAAAVMPASMALLREVYPEARARGRAVPVWAMGGAVASSCGPVLGGGLTQVNWRLIFFLNVPVGVVALSLLARARQSEPRAVPFDVLGQVTGAVAMVALTFGVIEAGARGFGDPVVVAALAMAVLAMAGFVLVQRSVAHPMVPPSLFRSRTVVITVVSGFAFMVGYYGLPFVVSLFLQQYRGLSVLRTAPLWAFSALMVPVGLGGPTVSPPATAVLLDAVPHDQAGVASGVFNTGRQLGGALAVAVFGGLLAQPGAFVRGADASLWIAAGVLALTAILTLFLPTAQETS